MLGHLSGIFCGWVIKDYIGKYTLPSIKGVKWFESVILFKYLNSKYFVRINDKEEDYINKILNSPTVTEYNKIYQKRPPQRSFFN